MCRVWSPKGEVICFLRAIGTTPYVSPVGAEEANGVETYDEVIAEAKRLESMVR